MERVLFLGFGYSVYKAVQLARQLKPNADILWITEYSDLKYPLEIVENLLSFGHSLKDWSKSRAKIKTDFERRLSAINLAPTKVKKIVLDPAAGEVSFLSNQGQMTYSFDQAFIFPEPVYEVPEYAPEGACIWPQSSCVEKLIQNDMLEGHILAVGNDFSMVHSLVCSGKSFVWVRSGSFFADQVEFYLERYLMASGIRIENTEDLKEHTQRFLDREHYQALICSASPVVDAQKLVEMGLEGLFDLNDSQTVFNASKVTLIAPFRDKNSWSPGSCLENNLQTALDAVGKFLDPKVYKLPAPKARVWSIGSLKAGKIGLDVHEAEEKGHVPEWSILCAKQDPWSSGFVLQMVADKNTGKILGLQSVGTNADNWLDMGGLLMTEKGRLEDVMEHGFVSSTFGLHPLKRCASMLKNKMASTILGISPVELQESVRQGAEFFLLDVRSKEEFNQSRLPGAENIPLSELKKRAMQIPRFVALVVYSHCSGRAYQAARMLKSMGARQLYVLDGGFELWPLEKETEPILSQQGTSPGCGC